jgi:hypothetical protein
MTGAEYYLAMALVGVLGFLGSLANWLLTQKLRAELSDAKDELKTHMRDQFPDVKICNERHRAVDHRLDLLESEL